MTEQEMTMLQAQQQQCGFISGLGGGLFRGPFGGAGLPSQQSARLSNQQLMSRLCEAGIAEPACKRKYKVRDYSENLIQKEEKILPIEKR